jgi:hypothetical protein
MNSLLKGSFALLLFVGGQNSGPTLAPVPKFTGPIPVTADSYPFLAANRNLEPFDLAKHGYVEEEFIVSGRANVYDWAADGSLSVKAPNAPYATRILVRRPANASNFSGTVIVELMHAGRRYDWSMMWGYSSDYFVEHGDAWIGITLPGSIAGLQKFNPVRYAQLSFANPTPNQPCPGGSDSTLSDIEEGLRWDAISQVGALLKSNASGRPLSALRVQNVFLTMQSGDVMTYINAFHSRARLDSGKPVYDGYFVKSPAGPARINRCATAPGAGDPRQKIAKVNVPVIAVLAQGEVLDAASLRRPDGDAPGDQFRSYEVAAASHIDKAPYRGIPVFEDQTRAGNAQGTPAWPFAAKCDPEIPMAELSVMSYVFNAAFFDLDQWVRKGIAPPRSVPIEIKDAGTPQATLITDQYGHALGGVRSPYVEVPAANYFTTSPGPGTCREMGHQIAFDSAKMSALYGNLKNYATKVAQSADRLVKERWLTESDAKRIKAEAAARR